MKNTLKKWWVNAATLLVLVLGLALWIWLPWWGVLGAAVAIAL